MSDVWDQAASGVDPWMSKSDNSTWTKNVDEDENKKPGHKRDDSGASGATQTSDLSCRLCGDAGHFTRMCPKHDTAQGDGGSFNPRACFNCGEEGHDKHDCPNPRKPSGACFNCGEEGHNKADCTKPKVFKGTCNNCGVEGHPASACPQRTPDICKNCHGEGHVAKDCTENRKFDLTNVPDLLAEDAWAAMKQADNERDIDDLREAIKAYSKAAPAATWADIERKMREEDFNTYIIGLEHEVDDVMTLINLQGKLDCTYVVGFFTSPKALRNNLRIRWPESPEANLERLEDAGQAYDRHIPKCRNCDEMGHIAKHCKQDRVEVERTEIKCGNCGEVGHRVRDCPKPRKSQYGCRNCGSEEHEARECPEGRPADDVECRRCNETGHFAKDCPNATERPPRTCRNCGSEDHIMRDCDQPRNESMMTCRNCDKQGHAARDCPEPKDWSKVKCNRCGEMGHTVKRCPQPENPTDAGAFGTPEDDPWNTATGGDGDADGLADQLANADW